MSSKKPLKLAVLSLVGLLGLVSCKKSDDEIYSKPSNYDKPIVTFDGSEDEIHNNLMSVIYDAMHDGDASNKILDEALYLYAESVLGPYNGYTRRANDESITLKDAYIDVKNLGSSHEIVNAFIKAHSSYWNKDENGNHVEDDGKTIIAEDSDWVPGNIERANVKSKYEAVEKRIAEAMFAKISSENKVSSGSYSTKNYFSEKKFLKSLYEESYKVNFSYDMVENKIIVPYTVEAEDIFNEFEDYNHHDQIALHRELYQDSYSIGTTGADYSNCKYTYIEDEVVPSVYNDLLVEQYLLDEDIAAVRNSRGREINVIKIEKYSKASNNADLLVQYLVDEIYGANKPDASADHVNYNKKKSEEFGKGLFDKYSVIAKGLYDQITATTYPETWKGKKASEIVGDLHDKASDVYNPVEDVTIGTRNYSYYDNTTYGDLVKEYKKIEDAGNNYEALQDTKYSTFTDSGKRSLLEGFEQQKIDIMQSQNLTRGWFIQSKSATLDSNGTINDRLFKLSVANAKIEVNSDEACKALDDVDRYYKDGAEWKVRTAPAEGENKFLCSINGCFFLKFEGKSIEDDWKNDIVYDDGSAYYIVQVLEAAKDSKLRSTSATSYAKTREAGFMGEAIDAIAKIVGETGSYTSLSKNHWIEKMDIAFHDEAIYDYFKSNYPDIFDED